jgi:hypothetical protein
VPKSVMTKQVFSRPLHIFLVKLHESIGDTLKRNKKLDITYSLN